MFVGQAIGQLTEAPPTAAVSGAASAAEPVPEQPRGALADAEPGRLGSGSGLPHGGSPTAAQLPSHTEVEAAIQSAAAPGSGVLAPDANPRPEDTTTPVAVPESQASDWLGADLLPKGVVAELSQGAVTLQEGCEGEGEKDSARQEELSVAEAAAGEEKGEGEGVQPSSVSSVAELLPSGTEVEAAIESAAADVLATALTHPVQNLNVDPPLDRGTPSPQAEQGAASAVAPSESTAPVKGSGITAPDREAPKEPDQAREPGRTADSAQVLAAAARGAHADEAQAVAGQPARVGYAASPAAQTAARAEARAEAADQAELAAGAVDAAEFVLEDSHAKGVVRGPGGETEWALSEGGADGVASGEHLEKPSGRSSEAELTPGERLLHWEETLVAEPAANLLGPDVEGDAAGGAVAHKGGHVLLARGAKAGVRMPDCLKCILSRN